MTTLCLIVWSAIAALLAVRCRRGQTVYAASSALAVIPIAVSQWEYELLPLAGALHVLALGLYPLALFAILHRYRQSKQSTKPPLKDEETPSS